MKRRKGPIAKRQRAWPRALLCGATATLALGLCGCQTKVLGSSERRAEALQFYWEGDVVNHIEETIVLTRVEGMGRALGDFALDVGPGWRTAPRERLKGSDDWTLVSLDAVKRSAKSILATCDSHPYDVHVLQRHSRSAEASRRLRDEARSHRARGEPVYLVDQYDRGVRFRAVIFGAVGHPLVWVRIAQIEWKEVESTTPGATRTKLRVTSALVSPGSIVR